MSAFDLDEFLLKFRIPLLILLGGLILVGVGIIYLKGNLGNVGTKVEILSDQNNATGSSRIITAEIAGEVVRPGVYRLNDGDRVDDLLIKSGGFSVSADRVWTDKYLNRAAKIADGQKLYIPEQGELAPYQDQQSSVRGAKSSGGDQSVSPGFSSDSSGIININSASLQELDSLPGIGQVYGQSIIDHRPYSSVEELVSKGAIKQSLFDKIKNNITLY